MDINKISSMPEDELLSDDNFLLLFEEEDPIVRARLENKLTDRAKQLNVKAKFDHLLKAYKKEYEKFNKNTIKSISLPADDNKVRFHRFKDGKPIGIYDKRITEYITESYSIFVLGKIPYIYRDGLYHADENEVIIKGLIQNLIYDEILNIDIINRVYRLVLASEQLQRNYNELNQYPKNLICFKNGMFDVLNWKMEEHKPEYFSINQIPHEFYDVDNLSGTNIDNFINYALPDPDDQEMLFEYLGYCLTIDTSLQRFLVLTGKAGTGKSLIIRLAESMVGERNISNISMEQLNERFFPSCLLGKLMNTCADISSKAMDNVDGIKKATGEDALIHERKGKDAFSFKSYAKLLFSANEIPINMEEKSEALYRRMLIIRADNKPDKVDRDLWSKLENELPYVILKSLKALKRLLERGSILISNNSNYNVREIYKQSDNILAFLEDCLSDDSTRKEKQSELYKSYVEYCHGTGRTASSAYGFNKNLKNKGYKTITVNGYPYYVGLSFPEQGFYRVSNQENLPFK